MKLRRHLHVSTTLLGMVGLASWVTVACTGSSFSGAAGKKEAAKSATNGNNTGKDNSVDQANMDPPGAAGFPKGNLNPTWQKDGSAPGDQCPQCGPNSGWANDPNTVYVPVGGDKTLPDGFKGNCPTANNTVATCAGGTVHGDKIGTTTASAGGKTVKIVVYDPKDPNAQTDSASAPIRFFDDGFPGVFEVKPITPNQKNYLWAAVLTTSAGDAQTKANAVYMRLQGDQVVEKKTWTNLIGGPGGTRTYVLEGGGVVMARTGGHIYWIDPASTPEGDITQVDGGKHAYKLDGPREDFDRVCIVSYRKKDKNRYVGMAWGKGNFIEFPQANTAPFAPNFSAPSQSVTAGTTQWGYACGIDQSNGIYYSQWAMGGMPGQADGDNGPTLGVDVNAGAAVDPKQKSPNGQFTSNKLPNETMGPNTVAGKSSYAMGMDSDGNVLNGQGYYTMGYEPSTNTIWGSQQGTGMLGIFPHDCIVKSPDCNGYASFNTQQMGFVAGPISALGDGHMIGMVRNVGTVMLMSLKDPKDITQGINATPIAQLGGDPYMYTDFTGATLYLTNSLTTFDLSGGNFDPSKPVKGLGFAWANKAGTPTTWSNITFQVRCYTGATTDAPFDPDAQIKDALQQTVILTPSCQNKSYDHVDIQLVQTNNDTTLMNIGKIQVTAYQ